MQREKSLISNILMVNKTRLLNTSYNNRLVYTLNVTFPFLPSWGKGGGIVDPWVALVWWWNQSD